MTRPVIAVSLGAPGEAEKPCILSLVDDTLYEEGEELRLVLGNPRSEWKFGGSVGAPNETLVKIKDTADSKSKKRQEIIRAWSWISAGNYAAVNIPSVTLFDFPPAPQSPSSVLSKQSSALANREKPALWRLSRFLLYDWETHQRCRWCVFTLKMDRPSRERTTTPFLKVQPSSNSLAEH